MGNVANIFIAFGAFQAFALTVFLLVSPKRSLRKILFAIVLFTEGYALLESILVSTDLILEIPRIFGTSYLLNFTRGPLLLLFALSIVREDFKLKREHLVHFIPFAVLLVLGFRNFTMPSAEKLEFIESIRSGTRQNTTSGIIIGSFLIIQLFTYCGITIKLMVDYVNKFKKDRLARWYLRILIAFTAFLVLGFIYGLQNSLGGITIESFGTITMIIMTLLLQSLAYSFFRKQNFIDTKQKIAKGANGMALALEFETLMQTEKPYLNDAITLEEIARTLKVSSKALSQTINQRFGKTFKDLLNEQRVNEAKRLMESSDSDDLRIIDIGHDSGFNNKVSFYRVFKKFTGQSPSDYYERIRQNSATIH